MVLFISYFFFTTPLEGIHSRYLNHLKTIQLVANTLYRLLLLTQ